MESLYETGVRKYIDEFLLAEAAKERDYGDYWSASSAGYCMRKLVFERLGVPKTKEDDPRQQRVFSAGHVFHEWIQGITKAAGVSVAQELELQDEKLMVRGHFDDLIKVPSSLFDVETITANEGTPSERIATVPKEKLILYDYKTANSRSFGYKKELSHFHRMQIGTYMYMLRKRVEWDAELKACADGMKQLSEGRVLILEKDTLRTKEFEVHWDKQLAMDVYQYWSTLNGYWKANKLPNCTCVDYEGGFMAKQAYNDYWYNGEPCSMEWFKLWQENKKNEVL
jgi:hypothetical protein